MPTDDERREVAARLRALDVWEFDEGECIDQGDVENALGIINVDGAWCEAEGVMRLADLIEPEERTCHDDYDGRQFRCSECGSLIHLLKRDDTFDWEFLHPDFCPFCGAKVVE